MLSEKHLKLMLYSLSEAAGSCQKRSDKASRMLNTTRFIPQEAMAALEATRDSSNCLLAELAELEDMLAFMLYKVKNEKEE